MINLQGKLELYMDIDGLNLGSYIKTIYLLDCDIDHNMSLTKATRIILEGDFGYGHTRDTISSFHELQQFVNKYDSYNFIPTYIDTAGVKSYVTDCLEGVIPSEYIENHYLMERDMLIDQLYELQFENKNHFFETIWGGEFCDYIESLIEEDYEHEKELETLKSTNC